MFICSNCKLHSLHLEQFRFDHISQIKHLENTIEYERKRTELLQSRLDRVLRLTDTNSNSNSNSQGPVSIQSSVSPIKQRHIAEVESRKKYWESKVKEVDEIDRMDRTNQVVTTSDGQED